ncbi:hypothetical protein ACGVWS_10970 [Enterobacteriaceae bacterium LUAb1]
MNLYLMLLICMIGISSAIAATAGKNTGTATIKYTNIAAGTCTVTVNDVTVGGSAALLDTASAIRQNWPLLGKTDFTVALTSCSGMGDAQKRPGLTMTGSTMTFKGNSMLFRDAASTSQGFGIVLYTRQSMTAGAVPDVKNGISVNIPGFSNGQSINTNQTLNWSAAVSCGDSVGCTPGLSNELDGGTLFATITFTFSYS